MKIAVLDDYADAFRKVADFPRLKEHEVVAFRHSEKDPARQAARLADFDVVVLDYRLPGLDALEVVKVLRTERGLDIPIVIVTGQGSETVSAQAIHLGVDDYIVKHADYLHELPATLENVRHQVELTRERYHLRETSERLEHALAISPVVLYTLHPDTIVFPGHGERTTVGPERRHNPFVSDH